MHVAPQLGQDHLEEAQAARIVNVAPQLGQDHLEEAQAARIVNVAPQLKINFDDINGVHPHNRDKATKLTA